MIAIKKLVLAAVILLIALLFLRPQQSFALSCAEDHSRLKRWIDRFNGVATKYLQHYLAWYRFLDGKEYENTTANKKNMLVVSCLYPVIETNYLLADI